MRQNFKLIRGPVIPIPGKEGFTPGVLYLQGVKFGVTCEDEDRHLEEALDRISEVKVYGRTAIPRGTYRLITSHSPHFGGKILPEVLNVPGFSGVRIHGGNRAEDSLGCILVGKVRTADGIAQCADVVQRVVNAIDSADEVGTETWLEVV